MGYIIKHKKQSKNFARNKKLAQMMGVLNQKAGNAYRATCIISPTGVVKTDIKHAGHVGDIMQIMFKLVE